MYSCSLTGSNRVSGRFDPGRQGVIDLEQLGRSAFTWSAPSADELAIDLPKNGALKVVNATIRESNAFAVSKVRPHERRKNRPGNSCQSLMFYLLL
jgi:hypothetical protein